MRLTKQPLTPFGTAVIGLDIQQLLALPTSVWFAELTRLVAASRVVVFRGQALDDGAFVKFLKGFGSLTFTEGETHVDGAPDLNLVSNVGRLTPARSVLRFHARMSAATQSRHSGTAAVDDRSTLQPAAHPQLRG